MTKLEADNQFNLVTFQGKVLRAFERLRKALEREILIANRGYGFVEYEPTSGFLRRFVLSILRPIERRLGQNYSKSPQFLTLRNRATALLQEPEIGGTLEPLLTGILKSPLFRERLEIELILIVTSALTSRTLSDHFTIEREPQLFAMMVNELLENDLQFRSVAVR